MGKRILLRLSNRFIKGIVYRFLVDDGYEVVEAWDQDDLIYKLEVHAADFILYVLEVGENHAAPLYEGLAQFKKTKAAGNIPVMAIIPKDTAEYVSPAVEYGVEELVLLPRTKESYKTFLTDKLTAVLKRIDPDELQSEPEAVTFWESADSDVIRERLEADLRHAARGRYPLSLLMIRFTGVEGDKSEKFIERLKTNLRETDAIWRFTPNTWLISCPFTEKTFIIEVERKIFSAFESEIGQSGHHRKINLFTATYPTDEDNLSSLLNRLLNGIRNSMVINSITTPLNSLSRAELENYRKQIRQYRKYF